ncbi:MAG: glycosyltransferase family protein [Candidatus Micrarchaeota archaeon]|nr:glycosyltransferase family protein [Candidatus Micrarchaeota archaeon]
MKIVVIIQARMGSTRLPKKSLMRISGKPMIWHVVNRVKRAKRVSSVLVATTTNKEDQPLVSFLRKNKIAVYRGNPDDVLERYYYAAKEVSADVVIRITGDCPLVDPKLIDKAIRIFESGDYDYVGNTNQPWMDGFEVEVFSFSALQKAYLSAKLKSEREHVTPYIKKKKTFKKFFIKNDPRLSSVHCSVDRKEDLLFVRRIIRELAKKNMKEDFTYLDVIKVLNEHPKILEINKNSIINEGYFKSLSEDEIYAV